MRSIQMKQPTLRSMAQMSCFGFVLSLAILFPEASFAFQTPSSTIANPTNRQHSRLNAAIIDPGDIHSILATAQHAGDHVSPLSTILSSTIVYPSADAMAHIHGAAKATSTAPATIQQMLPNAGEAIQAEASKALDSGYKILDGSKIIHGGQKILPGFKETKSILAERYIPKPPTDNVFAEMKIYTTSLLSFARKLPYVVFFYVMAEWFIQPIGELYGEDLEEDPSGVAAETVSEVGVRAAILFGLVFVAFIFS